MKTQFSRHAFAASTVSLVLVAVLGPALLAHCASDEITPAVPGVTGPTGVNVDPNAGLPFNADDPAAAFLAKLVVEGEGGVKVAGATLQHEGQTYTTDANGSVTIPGVLVRNAKGAPLVAADYLPTSVLLTYPAAGADTLRVVLRKARANTTFAASAGGSISDGPMVVTFKASSFTNADGSPYTGEVRVAARGLDPTGEVLAFDMNGVPSYQDGFDPASIPQGFDRATSKTGDRSFMLPESAFQLELTDPSGAKLMLKDGEGATIVFRLSALTKRNVGDVIPTFSFDGAQQRWLETSSCTVVARGDAKECVGTVPHFSAWSIPAPSSTNSNCFAGFPSLEGFTDAQIAEYKSSVVYTVKGRTGNVVSPIADLFQLRALTSASEVQVTASFTFGGEKRVYEFAPNTQQFNSALATTVYSGTRPTDMVGDAFLGCPVTILAIAASKVTGATNACSDCAAPKRCTAIGNACVDIPLCANGVKDTGETGIDCGGTSCSARCGTGTTCAAASDCESGICDSVCLEDSCKNRVNDALSESDVDCGGECSTKCDLGKTCETFNDCKSGTCTNSVCVGTSGDAGSPADGGGATDGGSDAGDGGGMCMGSDLNCGGDCPMRCGEGQICVAPTDCNPGSSCVFNGASMVCNAGGPGGPGDPGAPGGPGGPGGDVCVPACVMPEMCVGGICL